MTHVTLATPIREHKDFRRLWLGLGISQFGSSVTTVALPLVALTVVHATALEMIFLTALAAIATALVSFPLGSIVEHRRKRPMMILANAARFLTIGSIPLAAAIAHITYWQLCVVAIVNAIAQVAFSAAAGAHLKALVPPELLVDATSRFQSTNWMSLSIGPLIGGWLVSVLTAPVAMLVDAASFVVDSFTIRRLQAPEGPPVVRIRSETRMARVFGGARFAWHHHPMRRLFASWLLYAGASAMMGPLTTVFYIKQLHFHAWQYGLLMGLPSIGGVIGSRMTPWLTRRYGLVRAMRLTSVARSPWYFLTPLAMPGLGGLAICVVAFFGTLLFSSASNSAILTYRQLETPDDLMARVTTFFSFATVAVQPIFIGIGALFATFSTVRVGIVCAAAFMALSVPLLPSAKPPPAV